MPLHFFDQFYIVDFIISVQFLLFCDFFFELYLFSKEKCKRTFVRNFLLIQ